MYGRFGFRAEPALVLAEVPPEYFQALHFAHDLPCGVVTFHAAFAARAGGALRESVAFAPEVDAHGGQLLPSLPGARHNQDGFFYARFRKA